MLNKLGKGAVVITRGGIIGTITKVVDDNEVLLEIAEGVRVRVQRPMISGVLAKTEPAPDAKGPPRNDNGPAGNAPVDIGAVLDNAVSKSGQQLNWRTSIVDLMKALGLDSSLSSRKELAQELGYTGDTGDSAAMNIWLHKQVIRKLSENGGQVPADLLD